MICRRAVSDETPIRPRQLGSAGNGVLALTVMLPSVLASVWLLGEGALPVHPIWAVNLLFFMNVTLGFWLISLLLKNGWLIDLYWTVLPPLIAVFYGLHPDAAPEPRRAAAACVLLGVWSVRLTHNYLRREGWRLGEREDWRFAKMRREQRHFWFSSFFSAYLSQHFALVGVTLPFWAVFHAAAPLGIVDGLSVTLAGAGLLLAKRADDQLRRFVEAKRAGRESRAVLDDGVWGWSRHPNYVGEQMFWWGIGGLGCAAGQPWVLVGALYNSLLLAGVTWMVEREMVGDPEFRESFLEYRRRVPVWFGRPRR